MMPQRTGSLAFSFPWGRRGRKDETVRVELVREATFVSALRGSEHTLVWVEHDVAPKSSNGAGRLMRVPYGGGSAALVLPLAQRVSLALVGGLAHVATREGVSVVREGRAISVVTTKDASEVLLAGGASLLALLLLVSRNAGTTMRPRTVWEVLEADTGAGRLRSIVESEDRPFAAAVPAGVWVAAWHIVEREDRGVHVVGGVETHVERVTGAWRLELDAAGGAEISCGHVRGLVPAGDGVFMIEDEHVVHVSVTGERTTCSSTQARGARALTAWRDGVVWTDGRVVWAGEIGGVPRELFVSTSLVQSVVAFGDDVVVHETDGPFEPATLRRLSDL
jgi:hypothetical protein